MSPIAQSIGKVRPQRERMVEARYQEERKRVFQRYVGAEWEFLDYTDAGRVDPSLRCHCGRPLRHRYRVKHKETGEIRSLGRVHLAEHLGLSDYAGQELQKAFQKIESSRRHVLKKLEMNATSPIKNDQRVHLPDKWQELLDAGVPLSDGEEKEALGIIERGEKLKRQEKWVALACNITPPPIPSPLSPLVRGILTGLVQQGSDVQIEEVAEEWASIGLVSPERYKSGRLKVLPHMIYFHDRLLSMKR